MAERPRAEWDGNYYDGQSARRINVKVVIAKSGLRLSRADGSQHYWLYPAIRQTQGSQPGERIRLEHGPGDTPESLEIADRAFLAAVKELAPDARLGTAFGGRRFAAIVLASVTGIIGVAAGAYFWGIPTLADRVSEHVPRAWEEQLGGFVMGSLLPPEKVCSDKAKLAALEGIVKALTRPLKTGYKYKVAISTDKDVNAFAAPGGYIVVFDGLLKKTSRPEELAGILAHEIQHVEKRHSTRSMLRQLSMQVMLSALTGDTGQLGQVLGAAGNLGDLAYQRGDEEEADREGMKLMLAAHIDPAGMIAAFETLQKEGGGEEDPNLTFLSTHPATGDRIKTLRGLAKAGVHGKYPALLPGVKWSKIAQGCH